MEYRNQMNEDCMVRQVSGTGIEIKCGNEKIAIDAFCKDDLKLYPDTPYDVYKDLLKEIQIGDLKILIFTHEHSDHFNVPLVVSAWKLNQDLQILSNCAVVRQLIQAGIPESNLKILISEPESGIADTVRQWNVYSLGPFRISGFYSQHAGETYAEIKNISMLLQIQEKTIAFLGDAEPDRKLFQKINEHRNIIDWMFLPFSLVGRKSVREKMADTISIKNLWVLHCPIEEKDVFEWTKHTRRICENAEDSLPFPVFGKPQMMWHKL